MKMMKNWKRFCTLDRHHAEGFTLVELIVVIAILAILAGVAVPAYSGYMAEANRTADQTLVSDVAKALTMHYYNSITSGGETKAGYVILTPNGGNDADEDIGDAAMDAAFGENWRETVTLAYSEWTDDGLLDLVAEYDADNLAAISNSTFLQVSTPESLMTAVSNMTSLVGDAVKTSNMSEATYRLNALGMGNIATSLDSMGLDPANPEHQEEYSTALSNLMVNEMAKMMQDENVNQDNNVITILFTYSSALAYAEQTGDDTVLNQLNTNLDDITYEQLAGQDYMTYVTDGLYDAEGNMHAGFAEFVADTQDANVEALYAMMGAVEKISGSYTDKDSLTNPDLYTTDAVAEQVGNYFNSVKALAGLSETERATLQNLPDGAIAIFVSADGVVSATPGAAWLAD